MINLVYTPQRSNLKADYKVDNDILIVKIGSVSETFDFAGLEEGVAREVVVEKLPVNPIVSVEKIGEELKITVIRFYGTDEKHLFETDSDYNAT